MILKRKAKGDPTQHLVRKDVDDFLKKTGMAETTFGFRVCNDPNLVREIRGGRDLKLSKVDAIYDFIASFAGA